MNPMKPGKKIRLARETLRTLSADETRRVAGGIAAGRTSTNDPTACFAARGGTRSSDDPTACFAGR
jgi:hypothetical protein